MEILDLFSGSQSLATQLKNDGHNVVTVDMVQYKGLPQLSHCINIFNFDYKIYAPGYFDFIFIGLPCTTFSKASGGLHFKNNITPVTSDAKQSILMLGLIYEILKYFQFPNFIIENPQGGLRNNFFFKNHCYFAKLTTYSTALGCFGFPTQKKTDLFTNIEELILFPTSYRVNGRYQKTELSNMTTRRKSSYPLEFCVFVSTALNTLRKKTPSGATQREY